MTITPECVTSGLDQRLRAVSPLILAGNRPAVCPESPTQAGDVLELLVRAVKDDLAPERFWLLCAAVAGSLPTAEEVVLGRRFFRLASTMEAMLWILDYSLEIARTRMAHMPIKVIQGGVLVDVDHSARHDLHTGIQQVVRRLLPPLAERHDVTPVVWTVPAQAMRTLMQAERRRVLRWGEEASDDDEDGEGPVLVVPWQSVVLLAEVPFPDACDRVAAMARYSGNAIVAVGYDCIPALSADMVPPPESNRFGHYLNVVKVMRRVGCIGATATTEFSGFCRALPAQGLAGPDVVEIPLPVGAGSRSQEEKDTGESEEAPLVVCVGTFEPRKNQLAVLHAAESLWREGLSFELLFIGGSGWDEDMPRAVSRLRRRARPIRVLREATDAELRGAYRRARFTVFASLHEGFGLPVAESFEQGTPVITSDFGSTREIALGGGALTIDPHDDEALISAMRRLLTDDELVRRLQAEIRHRPERSWEDYASEIWDRLVLPELLTLAAEEAEAG